jgi:hypothetical protein
VWGGMGERLFAYMYMRACTEHVCVCVFLCVLERRYLLLVLGTGLMRTKMSTCALLFPPCCAELSPLLPPVELARTVDEV